MLSSQRLRKRKRTTQLAWWTILLFVTLGCFFGSGSIAKAQTVGIYCTWGARMAVGSDQYYQNLTETYFIDLAAHTVYWNTLQTYTQVLVWADSFIELNLERPLHLTDSRGAQTNISTGNQAFVIDRISGQFYPVGANLYPSWDGYIMVGTQEFVWVNPGKCTRAGLIF